MANTQDVSRSPESDVLSKIKHILLVDDEDAILTAMARYFRKLGYAVDVAKEAEEAGALLDHRRYRLVILDLRLSSFGKAEGLEVLRDLRRHDPWTSVIVLSAWVSPEAEEAALRLDAAAVLRKPQPLGELARLAIALIGDPP